VRLGDLFLRRGRPIMAKALAPLAATVAPSVAASFARQHRRLSAGIGLAALAIGFATSTAIFNTTYQGQARVDAQLTNGADVTVTGTTMAPGGAILEQLRALSGVVAAEPMQHRLAYVGTDLQDLYGIDPASIGRATPMANAYFSNGDAAATLGLLSNNPAAALVSDETVTDFQLARGDTINLRLQNESGQYIVVPFIFAGVVREFPTAPRDSFIVANADYVAEKTGITAQEVVLIRSPDRMAEVKGAVERLVKAMPGVQVSDLSQATHLIGSSLTAVDLGGLTTLELGFAILLAAGATGLILALGVADRRRSFAVLAVLGAGPRVLASFVLGEAVLILLAGTISGMCIGAVVAEVLVKVLEGVFDPPPEGLSVPWLYLATLVAAIVAAMAIAVFNALREVRVDPVQRLREIS
jgi:putative ABC transport system permease protein